MSELEACRCEGRNYSSEVFRLKAGYDETMEQLDVVKRENKVSILTLYSDQIKLTLNISRTLPTRSRICSTSLAMAAVPSTSWTNRGGGSRSRRKSFRELLRRPRVPSSRRRTRLARRTSCLLISSYLMLSVRF